MKSITESSSLYDGLDQMSTTEILIGINQEDQKVALSIKKIIPFISDFIDIASQKLMNGGRLFYIGAGTSGRLGIVDASECPLHLVLTMILLWVLLLVVIRLLEKQLNLLKMI